MCFEDSLGRSTQNVPKTHNNSYFIMPKTLLVWVDRPKLSQDTHTNIKLNVISKEEFELINPNSF